LEDAMSKVSFVIAVGLVMMALPGTDARAAAFCAYAGGGRGASWENCGYYTWEQCLAGASGSGGFCIRNPHDPALWGYPVAPTRPYKHRRHAY
jgi:Protein of unknown function (DUF3551)